MRKPIIAVTAAFAVTALASCGQAKVDVQELAGKLKDNVQYSEELNEINPEVTLKRYGIDADIIEECVSYAGTRAVADELAVFKTTDTDTVNTKAIEHLESQISSYESYRPDEVPKLGDAVLYTYNDIVIVCVSEDSGTAQKIIADYTAK